MQVPNTTPDLVTEGNESSGGPGGRSPAQGPPRLVWVLSGILAVVLSYAGVHEMHPAGAPEHMPDSQVVAWAEPAAGQIAAGGSLGIVAAFLLMLFAIGWAEQLRLMGSAPWIADFARASLYSTATVLGLGALLQVMAGIAAMPSEQTGQPSLIATLVNLYGNLIAMAWVLLLPAILAGALVPRPRRIWVFATSVIASCLMALALVVPPVAWMVAAVWIVVICVGSMISEAAEGQPALVLQPVPASPVGPTDGG